MDKELIDQGRDLLNDVKWNELFKLIEEKFGAILDSLRDEQKREDLIGKLSKLGKQLALHKIPELVVEGESLNIIKQTMIPILENQLKEVSVHMIEILTDHFDVKLTELKLFGESNIEKHLKIQTKNEQHTLYDDKSGIQKINQLEIVLQKIKPKFNHIKFQYKKRNSSKDYSIAELALTAPRMTLQIVWNLGREMDFQPCASLCELKCNFDKLNIHILDEKYELFDTVLAPLISNMIKSKICSSIEESLKTTLQQLHSQFDKLLISHATDSMKGKSNVVQNTNGSMNSPKLK